MEEEKRYKAVRLDPDRILDLINATGVRCQMYRHISFEGLEGARAVGVNFDFAYNSFFMVLEREDWPVCIPGQMLEVVEAVEAIVEIKLADPNAEQ